MEASLAAATPGADHARVGSGDGATKKRSPNYVKPRPADPAVISGILSSLDTLMPPEDFDYTPHHFLAAQDGQARPYSAAGSVASAPNVPRSVTLSPYSSQYDVRGSPDSAQFQGHAQEEHHREGEDDDDDDFATPPSIPTSRPPSGLSQYAAPRPPSYFGNTTPSRLRRPSIASRTSSGSVLQEKDLRNIRKLSAESWVKPGAKTERSSLNGQALRSPPRSLRRINSQETLKPEPSAGEDRLASNGIYDVPATPALSKAEQIIARTTPNASMSSPRSRVFLGDTTLDEQQLAAESPGSVITYPEIVDSPSRTRQTSGSETALSTPPSSSNRKSSAKASPIVDSIPLRTSSLRQGSRSPAPKKKKGRKSRRETDDKGEKSAWVGGKSETIPESSWADLGDDDDTVKRIRQLREQRETRLRQSRAFTLSEEVPPLGARSISLDIPVTQYATRRSEDGRSSTSRVRPPPNRSETEPSAKAQRLLGLSAEELLHGPSGAYSHTSSPGNSYMDAASRSSRSPAARPDSSDVRPATQGSYNANIALDYSYTEAVDALRDVVGDNGRPGTGQNRYGTSTPPPVPNTLPSRGRDLQSHANGIKSTPNSPPTSKTKRNLQDRWSQHPDLPLDFNERKSRRKSMSDAKHTRIMEEQLGLERRDSIEDAVMEYLSAPRLSQKIRHPLTGRTISFSEVGDPDGAAVLVCLGMGLTRYVTAFYDELALTLRLRLITLERPGVGKSQPYPASDRSGPLSWPDDVLTVCQHLGIEQFSILAHSAGAIYALATALILPQMIRGKVQLLAPWIPPSQLEMVSHSAASAPPAGVLPRSQRILRVLPTPFLKAANSSFMTATSASLKPASKRKINAAKMQQQQQQQREASKSPDRRKERAPQSERPNVHHRESMMMMDQLMPGTNPMENFLVPANGEEAPGPSPLKEALFLSATATPTDPNFAFASSALNAAEHEERERKVEYTSRLTHRTWELATRDSNPATDLLVCFERNRDVGFRYIDIHREVVITHGSEDKRVPLANVKWLAEQMNRRALAGMSHVAPPSRHPWDGDVDPSQGGCEVRVLEGEGHGLMASPIIMGDVLTELSGYWVGDGKRRPSD